MTPLHDVAIYSPFAALFYGDRPNDGPGGAELQTTILAGELAARGLRVAHIIYPVPNPPPAAPGRPSLVQRSEYSGGGRFSGAREFAAIARAFGEADAHVGIVRGSGGYLIPAAAHASLRRRRLIFSASNDLDFEVVRPDRNPHMLRAYRFAMSRCDRIVAQTRQQEALAHTAFPQKEATLIPSFAETREPVSSERSYFLWADRIVEYKRPELYLDLAERVPEAVFHMIALPTNETDPELARRVHERGEALDNVRVLPPRPRDQLLEEMSQAAAMVTTSEVEGMPNTFLEAWARGLPVLSLSVDPDDKITEYGTGWLAGGDAEVFAEGARRLWHEPEFRALLGGQAREFVRGTHSPDVVADQWVSLVEELMSRS